MFVAVMVICLLNHPGRCQTDRAYGLRSYDICNSYINLRAAELRGYAVVSGAYCELRPTSSLRYPYYAESDQ